MHRRAVVVAVSRAARGLLAPGAVTRPTTAAAWLATPSLRSPARSLHVSSGSAATYWRGDRGDDVPVSKLEAPRTPLLSTGTLLPRPHLPGRGEQPASVAALQRLLPALSDILSAAY